MSDIVNYYKGYHRMYGDRAYKMGSVKDTSRVYFLKEYIEAHTPEGGSVLDVGCGDLYLSTLLPQFKWQGVDVGPPLDAPHDKILKHDISVTPYDLPAKEYDTVICSEVLEHVWDPYIVTKEIRRLIKPNGTFIMSTPNFDHIDWLLSRHRAALYDPMQSHLVEHIRHYNVDTHTKMLTECGFNVAMHHGADAHYSGFFQDARKILMSILNDDFDAKLTIGQVDQMLGLMFPDFSHTIMLIAKPATYVGNSTVLTGR